MTDHATATRARARTLLGTCPLTRSWRAWRLRSRIGMSRACCGPPHVLELALLARAAVRLDAAERGAVRQALLDALRVAAELEVLAAAA